MKLNPGTRTRLVVKPLKVTLTDEEILADLQYPVSADRTRESRSSRKTHATPR